MVVQGKVIGGKIVVDEDVALPEGAYVRITLDGDATFALDPELKPHLRTSLQELADGDAVDYDTLSAELDRDS